MAPPSHTTSAGPDTPLYSHSPAELHESYDPSFSTTDNWLQTQPGLGLNAYDSSTSNAATFAVEFGMNASNSGHDSLRPPALSETPSYHYGIQSHPGNTPMTANHQYGNLHNPIAHQGQQDHFHGSHYQSSVPPATHQHMRQPQWQTGLQEPALHSMDESRRRELWMNRYAEFDRQATEAVPRFAPSYLQSHPIQMSSYNTRPTWPHQAPEPATLPGPGAPPAGSAMPTGSAMSQGPMLQPGLAMPPRLAVPPELAMPSRLAMPSQQHNAVSVNSSGQSIQVPRNVAAIPPQQGDASNASSYYQTFPVNEDNTGTSSTTARPNAQGSSMSFEYWRPPQASALRANTSGVGAPRADAVPLPSRDTFLANHLRVVKRPPEEECPICFHRFRNAVSLPCDHVFCRDCIKRWFRRSNTCPFDRQKLFRWPAQRVRTAQGNGGQG